MDFEEMLKYRRSSNAFAKKMGICVEEIAEGYARVTKTVQEDEINPGGTTHGGVCFTLADIVAGSASTVHGRLSATVNASYQYLGACYAGDTLTAEAREIKSGRTICVYEVSIKDQNGKHVGQGTFTFFLKDQKLEF